MADPKVSAKEPQLAPPSALTEAQIRSIVREEMGKWKHDAAHSSDAGRLGAQRARDVEAGVNADQ